MAVDTVRTIMDELNVEFLERQDAIHAVWLCLLSGQHGYLQGPSGTAKSTLLNATARHIVGARYWHIQMDRTLDKSDSFGQYDIARFETEKVWERDYADTFGDCHIALLDEIDKAGPASLVPYLEMLQERRFKPGKTWVQAPLVSAFGAANGSLDSEDGILRAIADRFLVRVEVGYLAETGHFIDLLQSAVVPRPKASATITLEQLEHIRTVEVPAVTLPERVAYAISELRRDLAGQDIVCSDRRWKAAVTVLQANAWLAGRQEITEEDLAVLRFVLWSREDQVPVVRRAVLAAGSAFARSVAECTAMIDDVSGEVAARAKESSDSRAALSGTVLLKLNKIEALVEALAGAEQGGATDVTTLRAALTDARTQVFEVCLGMSPTAARRKARARVAA